MVTAVPATRQILLPALLVLALSVRLTAAFLERSIPEKDAAEYDRLAVDLADGKGYRNERGEKSAWRPPLYPAFLAAIYKIGGHNYLIVRVVQALLSTAIVGIIFLLARLIFGVSAAYWAAGIASVYPAFYAYYFGCASLSTETLYTFLLVFAFYEYFRYALFAKAADLILSGVSLGLAILARPVPALLAGGLPFLFWAAGYRTPKLRTTLVFFWTAVGLTLLPWTFRNYGVFGELVPVTTLGGANFYLGNHAGADGMGGSRDPNLDFYKDVYYPQDAALDAAGKSETEKARYFYGKGREFIASEPREFAALYLRKLALFVDPRMTVEIGGRKKVIWEPGYLAVLVGVLAAWFRSKWGEAERRAALVFAGIMLYFWAMHGLTVATGRFRFPLEPLLIILASRALRVERSRS